MENESATPSQSQDPVFRRLTEDGVEYADGTFIPYQQCLLMQGNGYAFLEDEEHGL
jgi:hypothetical protein